MQLPSFQLFGHYLLKYIRPLLYGGIGVLSVVIGWVYLSREIFFDDAFMFIRYAENLARHGTFGWNAGEPAYGCTSMGYVFSTFLLLKLGLLNFVSQAKLLQIQSAFFLFLSLFVIYRSNLLILSKNKSYRQEISLALVLLLLLNPLMRRNITGMDALMSLWSNALLVYTCFLFHRTKSRRHLFLLIFAAFFSFFVRPDNGLYATLFPFLFILIWHKNKQDLLIFILGLGSLLCLDSLAKYVYFGAILPLPFYVKNQGFYEAYLGIDLWNTWHYLGDFLLYLSPLIFLVIRLLKKSQLLKILPMGIPFLLTQIYFFQTVPIMGYDARLLLPSTPFVLAIVLVLYEAYDWKQRTDFKSLMFRYVGAIGILVLSISGLHYGGKKVFAQKKRKAIQAAKKFDLGLPVRASHDSLAWNSVLHITKLVQEIGDKDFVLAASEHGFIASHNLDTQILCLIGLHNPLSLQGQALSEENMELALKKYSPDLIWMYQYNYPSLTYALMQSSEFQEHYDYYHDLLDLGLAIRRDSPYKEKIRQYLAGIYPERNIEEHLLKVY